MKKSKLFSLIIFSCLTLASCQTVEMESKAEPGQDRLSGIVWRTNFYFGSYTYQYVGSRLSAIIDSTYYDSDSSLALVRRYDFIQDSINPLLIVEKKSTATQDSQPVFEYYYNNDTGLLDSLKDLSNAMLEYYTYTFDSESEVVREQIVETRSNGDTTDITVYEYENRALFARTRIDFSSNDTIVDSSYVESPFFEARPFNTLDWSNEKYYMKHVYTDTSNAYYGHSEGSFIGSFISSLRRDYYYQQNN